MVPGEQEFRGIVYFTKPRLIHFVNPQFRCAAEAVFDASQNTVHIMLITFELQNGIYNMFQHFGPGDVALFCDVPDKNDGRFGLLCKLEDRRGTFTHLRNTSGRRFHGFVINGLNGVDNNQLR
ncbi:hypothetical protein SDC9_129763 [bioreactor metagenome]|uniref:Uncharacterized protein n=1 Tax=bioreactor metagenome TaxID=1076179 RepID=A0A645D0S6_9ZZZZ